MLPSVLIAAIAFTATGACQNFSSSSIIRPLLHAKFSLEPALGPIPVPAGSRIVEPIVGGTITGAINGTITAGLIAPTIFGPLTNPNFTSISDTYLYGEIDGGGVFYVQSPGIGISARSVVRLQIEAGREYAYLQREFIFARVVANTNTRSVELEAFTVQRPQIRPSMR